MTEKTEPKKDEQLSGLWDVFHQHSDKAIKACIYLLVALCVALIIIAIYMTNPSNASQRSSSEEPDARVIKEAKPEPVSRDCWLESNSSVVECQNTTDLYSDIFEALQHVQYEQEVALNIYNQDFPKSTIANKWIPADKAVTKISITNGNFTNIRNEAFNCIDFAKTEVLMLLGVNLSTLNNGVLLGLSKLRTLHIVGRVGHVDRCFFQPVQSELVQLRISAELIISGHKNVFGISHLPNLASLDISDNNILGSLSKNFFLAVPNVECLTISNSRITSINENAFDDIADNLHILDLSNNLLTVIDVRSIEHILALGNVNMYLLGNDWYCDCDLQPLINLYDKYEDRFGDTPYCKGPLARYGVLFKNVTFGTECDAGSDEESMLEVPESPAMPPNTVRPTIGDVSVQPSPFQMRCLSVLQMPSDENSSSSKQLEYFLFAPPCHEFELFLFQNNSVQVVIVDADITINIVWFSEAVENFVYTIDGITVDYNCETYTDPYLIVDDLLENTTYTFCLVPAGMDSITPFNCLPLHVPIRIHSDDTTWISADEKQFTIGIVCLIFTCSMMLGGVVAYFGIKAYPDLLEGSRHVLVVKKSDQTCYVSTITEGEYMDKQMMQSNSLKKKGSLNKSPSPCCHKIPKFNSFPQLSPLPPPLPLQKTSVGSTDESLKEADDYYELPCIFNKPHLCELQCIPNKYELSPNSPPPLPKRNSDVLLYSSSSELLPEGLPHPKMSF